MADTFLDMAADSPVPVLYGIHSNVKAKLVCRPRWPFMTSIPNGVARRDGNLAEAFFAWLVDELW